MPQPLVPLGSAPLTIPSHPATQPLSLPSARSDQGIVTSFNGESTSDRSFNEMGFISSRGFPATDAWSPSGRKSAKSSGTGPAHACWTVKEWATRATSTSSASFSGVSSGARIFVNGLQTATGGLGNRTGDAQLTEAHWRVSRS